MAVRGGRDPQDQTMYRSIAMQDQDSKPSPPGSERTMDDPRTTARPIATPGHYTLAQPRRDEMTATMEEAIHAPEHARMVTEYDTLIDLWWSVMGRKVRYTRDPQEIVGIKMTAAALNGEWRERDGLWRVLSEADTLTLHAIEVRRERQRIAESQAEGALPLLSEVAA